ncbi:ANTAR domain-containing protein [Georgenia thermotolerans]|uniref:ANTAR domain-containing protein n=1 Tax=Georgenia thermotolerans TaxID=527326 RepID=A0A7J5USP0_9MICO|nr:ANTAR domain-containing protein [Georgenia thermotolerans]KAE8765297.1 ANTAR domain-containing protein [Georgenia thermotolerans]
MPQRPGAGPFDDEKAFTDELAAIERYIVRLRERPDIEALLQGLESAQEELRAADEEVRAQQAELARLAESHRMGRWQHERLLAVLPAAIVTTDATGVLRSVNAAAAALLGLRVDRLVRKPLFALVDAPDRPELRRRLTAAVDDAGSFRQVVTLFGRHRQAVRVEADVTVVLDPDASSAEATWVLLPTEEESGRLVTAGYRHALAHALVRLTELPLRRHDRRSDLEEVADICAQALGEGAAVSVTAGEPVRPEVVATTSAFAQAVDGAQMVAQEGPCQAAWQGHETVVVQDLEHDARWPRFTARSRGTGARSVLAVPVEVGDERVGVLNVYAPGAHAWDAERVEVAELLASAAAAAVHEIDLKAELEDLARNLGAALDSRATIDQAKGILMATFSCDAEEAFRRLVKMSRDSNVKLRTLAARIVTQTAAGTSLLT